MAEKESAAAATPPAKLEQRNPFQAPTKAGGLISIEQQRAVAYVQAAMLVARAMPRDPRRALDMILQDCTDISLAEEAEYEYSRGGSKISGPSIRLLEAVARRWGNLETGIEEISRQDGYSEFRAFAVDLETGWRDSKIFQVKHWRDTQKGGYLLTDERDIYELGANMGARRKRACMEAVIPSDVMRQAAEACATTLQAKVEITPEFLKGLIESFAKYGVTKEMIEARIQRHITALSPGLAVQLRRIYNALRDGMAQPQDFFDMATPAGNGESAAPAKPKTGPAALREGVVDKGAAKPPAAEKKPDPPAGGEPTLADVNAMLERARALLPKINSGSEADKETALLQVDDAELLAGSLPLEDLKSARKAIAAVRQEIKTAKVGAKK